MNSNATAQTPFHGPTRAAPAAKLVRVKHPAPSIEELRAALRPLAMLALQSDRYTHDADYRDATDAAIAAVQKMREEGK